MSSDSQDTYPMPEHGWTCFHCGETFTKPGTAREHFGPTPNSEPGCAIKVRLGGERGLLHALRKAETQLLQYMEEDTALHRTMHAMQSRHYDALMSAEEAGYARGLKDYMEVERQRDNLLTSMKHIKYAAMDIAIERRAIAKAAENAITEVQAKVISTCADSGVVHCAG